MTLLYDSQLSPIRQTCRKGNWCLHLLSLAAYTLTCRTWCSSKGTAAIAFWASFLDAVVPDDAAPPAAFVATPWLFRHVASASFANTTSDSLVLVDFDVAAMYAVQEINFNFLLDISAFNWWLLEAEGGSGG